MNVKKHLGGLALDIADCEAGQDRRPCTCGIAEYDQVASLRYQVRVQGNDGCRALQSILCNVSDSMPRVLRQRVVIDKRIGNLRAYQYEEEQDRRGDDCFYDRRAALSTPTFPYNSMPCHPYPIRFGDCGVKANRL